MERSSEARLNLHNLIIRHNQLLEQRVSELQTQYAGVVNIHHVDTYTIFNEELDSGVHKNTTEDCYNSGLS